MPYEDLIPPDKYPSLKDTPFAKRHREQYRPDRPIIPRYTAPPKGMYFTRENYFPTTPAVPQEQAVAQMKNYERLTPSERWLYSMLPGVARGAEWLSKNTPTWAKPATSFAGNLLTKLDVSAEFIERSSGLASQWNEARQNPEQMPGFLQNLNAAWYAGSMKYDVTNLPVWDEDAKRYTIPTDLPGTAAMVQARNRIEELTNAGMDIGDATLQGAEEAGDFATLIKEAERTAALTDITRTALKAAETAGDVRAAAKIAREALQTTALTATDKFALLLAGGDPFKMPATKWGQFLRRINPFALTPSSRAYEYITQISNNVNSQIVGPAGKAAEIMRRGGRGGGGG